MVWKPDMVLWETSLPWIRSNHEHESIPHFHWQVPISWRHFDQCGAMARLCCAHFAGSIEHMDKVDEVARKLEQIDGRYAEVGPGKVATSFGGAIA